MERLPWCLLTLQVILGYVHFKSFSRHSYPERLTVVSAYICHIFSAGIPPSMRLIPRTYSKWEAAGKVALTVTPWHIAGNTREQSVPAVVVSKNCVQYYEVSVH